MSDEKTMIDCELHGKSDTAAICGHLMKNHGLPLGFIENSSNPDDLQGWCYACEYMYLQENDKTEKFRKFCDYAIVCTKCYREIKAHHDISA